MIKTRRIACLDLDAFFVEVALKEHPEFRGKPVIVGGSATGRGVVCSASYEARRFKIRSGMPSWQALQRCPYLKVLPVPGIVGEMSNQVRELLKRWCPVVDSASIDEFYLDFSGCDRIYPFNITLGEQICQNLRETLDLPATIGFSTNKMVAKVASDAAKPRGILDILPGAESRFLAPLLLKKIPGIGPKTEVLLKSLGLTYVGEIPQLSVEMWRSVLGLVGESLHRYAQGICESPVIPDEQKFHQKRLSRERTLSESTISLDRLTAILSRLSEKAGYDLRQGGLTCAGLTVKLRYDDFITNTRSRKIPRTNKDQDIFSAAQCLFKELFTRRQKIRLLGVALDHLQSGGVTEDFWKLLQPEQKQRLPDLINEVRARFGFKSILRARSVTSPREKKAL